MKRAHKEPRGYLQILHPGLLDKLISSINQADDKILYNYVVSKTFFMASLTKNY